MKTLLNRPTTGIDLPSEPIYKEIVEKNTQATERGRKVLNHQLKVNW